MQLRAACEPAAACCALVSLPCVKRCHEEHHPFAWHCAAAAAVHACCLHRPVACCSLPTCCCCWSPRHCHAAECCEHWSRHAVEQQKVSPWQPVGWRRWAGQVTAPGRKHPRRHCYDCGRAPSWRLHHCAYRVTTMTMKTWMWRGRTHCPAACYCHLRCLHASCATRCR